MSDYADGEAEGVAERIQLSDLFKRNSNFWIHFLAIESLKKYCRLAFASGKKGNEEISFIETKLPMISEKKIAKGKIYLLKNKQSQSKAPL